MTPATAVARTPSRWPSGTRVPLDHTRPTLVMSLHPKCPCSKASLHELESLIAHGSGKMAVHILFINPANAPAGWLDGDLWRQANALPNVSILLDPDGVDSKAFGATTSGDVAFYSPDGTLLFHGGITDGRGHEGDSAGQSAILAVLRGEKPCTGQTLVYGCSLCNAPATKPAAISSTSRELEK